MKIKNLKSNSFIIWAITGVLVFLTALLLVLFISYSNRISQSSDTISYDKYYAFIAGDSNSSFWKSVYSACQKAGKEANACVEMLSENLSTNYSNLELMEIAIASGVDGIIVAADESEEMTFAINSALEKEIPVITIFSDNTNSERTSFVGVSNYNLGNEYGNLILKLAREKTFTKDSINAVILMDANSETSGQNVLYAAIKEIVEVGDGKEEPMLPINISMFAVDSTNNFSVEESVRSMFVANKDSLPDIVVCLNEIDTTSIYQAVVDYNAVGLIHILGYYDSEPVLKGIERNVIYSTISIDTDEMGRSCIDALTEYSEYGNTSQYFTSDISVITKENVSQYMEDLADED